MLLSPSTASHLPRPSAFRLAPQGGPLKLKPLVSGDRRATRGLATPDLVICSEFMLAFSFLFLFSPSFLLLSLLFFFLFAKPPGNLFCFLAANL